MANTGYKGWTTLEEYDPATGKATGNTKPNSEYDTDYVPPVYDNIACPLADTTPPSIPSNLRITHDKDWDGDGVHPDYVLEWDASFDNIDHYEVWRNQDGGIYTLLSTTSNLGLWIGNPNSTITFCYKIKAVDKDGNKSAFSTELCRAKLIPPAPTQPTLAISPTSKMAPKTGTSFYITVVSNTTWYVGTNVGWITLDQSQGTGDGNVRVSVLSSSEPGIRTGKVTFTIGSITQECIVNQ